VETEDKAAGSSIIQSTARVFHIVTKGHRKNSTARAPTTRLSRGNSFADAPNREDRISGAEAQAIAPASAIAAVKVGRVTAAEQETVAAVAAASVVVREVAAVLSAVSIGAAAQRAAPAHAAVPAEEAPAAVAPGAVEVAAEDEVEEAAAGAAGKKV